jgi:hypothetical protein
MKATELRIGNLVNYKIVDELDERKEWFEPCEIDAVDLQIIHSDYQPIPLTEEWFLKFGFDKLGEFGEYYRIFNKGLIIDIEDAGNEFIVWVRIGDAILEPLLEVGYPIAYIQYVHQLQNLYFALTNEELTLVK